MNRLRFHPFPHPFFHLVARRMTGIGLVVALGWLAAGKAVAGGGPQNVLVVVNGASQSSLEVANEYQRLRNIPERNFFYLESSNTAAFYTGGDLRRIMTSGSFRTNCLWPVLNYIRANGMTNHIDYIVYSTDIPTRIDVTAETGGSTEYYSITAMTQFGDLVEPVNTAGMAVNSAASFRGFTYVSGSPSTYTTNFTHARVWGTIGSLPQRFYISTVLGWTHWFGNTPEELKNYLARSRNADGTRPTGTVYLDANVDVRGTTRSGRFLGTSNELAGLGIPSLILTGNPSPYSITNKPDILGAMMGAAAPEVPAGSYYLPGSIAESLTSWSGIMDNTGIGQFRMSQHLGVGVAGTSGTVTEPFAIESKFPTSRMHAHYARGATLGEAFQFSVWTPYHLLIMGDALCRPGAIIPTVTLTNLAEGDVVTGSRTLFPGASTASASGLAGFDLFLDGLPWQTAPANGSVTLNTAILADGGHELRVIAYENSAIRTQGDRVVNFRVNNFGEQLLFDATNYASTVGGTNILLKVTRTGVTSGLVDLWKGPTWLGSLSGTSSNASISVTNFGPGRSILRATMAMTSGTVRSAPIPVDVLPAADSTPPTIARFSIQTGTNNQMQGLSSKPAYRSGDYIYLGAVPSEPISMTNLVVKVGGGTVTPFPISWVGMSSTNVIPNLAGLTNPMTYRYQLLSTRDAEGQLPVAFSLRDAAGNTNIVTNFIPTDYTPPDAQTVQVVPNTTLPGATVTVNCLMTEPVATNATVRVGGNIATFLSSNGNWQTFSYTVPLSAAPGTNSISVSNLIDLAGNTGGTFSQNDNFEARTLGAKISSYNPSWSTYTNATTTPTWFITNTPVASGSTKSLGLMDAPSVSQLCFFQLGSSNIGATIEFDVYLDNRNPGGNAQLSVFASVDTRSLKETGIACNQTTGSAWQLEIRNRTFTTALATNLALQTWYRVRFANDVKNNLWSAWLNGTALGIDVPYSDDTNNFPYVANFTFGNGSIDEDVYLDNVSATGYLRPALVISGYADTWTGNTSGSWGTDVNWTNSGGASSYADGDVVIFDDTLYKNPTITNATPGAVVTPGSMLFNNNRTNYIVSANIGGPGTLTKSGSAWLTLSGSNSFNGGVTLNAGTLLVNGDSAGATNTVTVSSLATLGGNGTNGGSVVMSAGSKLVPGGMNTMGTLTLTNNLTLNGNTLYFDLGNAAATSDRVAVGNILNLNGANNIVLSFPSGPAPAGTYTLMTMGSKTGSGTLTLVGTYTNVALNVTATSVQLVVGAGGTYVNNLTWKGNVNGTWDNSTANWATNGGTGAIYADGSDVTFDDSLAANPTVSSGGTLLPNSVTFDNSLTNYIISAAIGGTNAMTKLSPATATLNGANSFSGGVTLLAGTLEAGNGNALGAGLLKLNGGILSNSVSLTLTNAISLGGAASLGVGTGATNVITSALTNVGSLKLIGPGTVILGGNNSFSGGVTMNGGTNSLNSATALGTGVFTINGGVLDNKTGTSLSNANNNAQIWNSNFTFAGSSPLNLGTGAVTLNNNITISGPASVLVVGGNISGTGGLSHSGNSSLLFPGSLSFSGGVTNTGGWLTNTGLNTYSGATTLTGGTNVFNSIANVGQPSAWGAPNNAANGVITVNGTVRYTGSTNCTSDRAFNWIGGTFYNDSSATKLILTGGITNSNSGSITFRGGGSFVVNSLINVSGGGVTRTDGGTVYLTNSLNQFTGNISISDGYFFIDTIADSGAACSIGKGTTITLGQLNGNTTGKLQLAATNGSSCNRAITIIGGTGAAASGALIENTAAGTTTTFSGNVTSVITNLTTSPILTLTGAGNGALSGVFGINTNPATALAITKSGAGTWTISGLNTNRGPVTVSAGTLLINGDSSLATNTVTVANLASFGGNGTNGGNVVLSAGGKLVPGGLNSVGTLTVTNSLTLNGSTLSFDLGNVAATSDRVAVGSGLNLNSANNIVLSFPDGPAPQGTYTLMTMAATAGAGTLALQAGYTNVTLNVTTTSVQLVVGAGGTHANNFTWKGTVNGTWDTSTANWANNGAAGAVYANGLDVTFDDSLTANATVSSAGTVLPNSVTLLNNLTNYTIAAAIGGTTALTKNGTANITLTGANSYTGDTIVNAGTLAVSGGGAIYSPNAMLNIGSGATAATNTLAAGGAITIQTLLATNVINGGLTNSYLNFTGGTLVTSNNNGIAANILLASGLTFNSSWTLAGGTNIFGNAVTNAGATASVLLGSAANNVRATVNSNGVWWNAIPAGSSATNTISLTIGAGAATNNLLVINGGTLIVTNFAGGASGAISAGSANNSAGNQIVITNGGQVFTRAGNAGASTGNIGASGGINNSLVVAGTNSAGRKSTWTFLGGERLSIGLNSTSASSSNAWVRVDAGGVITNVSLNAYGNSYLFVTNGGQMFTADCTFGRMGRNSLLVVAGFDAAGNGSLLKLNANNLVCGGGTGTVSSQQPGTNVTVRADTGGIITNANQVIVGKDTNSYGNTIIITNGGRLFSYNNATIGYAGGSCSNGVIVGGSFGTTNSTWNNGTGSLIIGNGTDFTNNYLTLNTGGILTNVSGVTLGGVNSAIYFNGGKLAAGANGNLITTNASTIGATNYVLTGGAVIDTVTFNVTNALPLVEDPNSPGGGLTKLGAGTLVLTNVNSYSGTTLINAGRLALARNAAMADSPNIIVAGGATLDVSGLSSPFTLGGGQTLSNGAAGAVIDGNNDCRAGTMALVYDATNACLILTNGGMTLSASTVIQINNTGPQLAAGTTNKIITALAGGSVTAAALPPVTVGGNGAAQAVSLAINHGELELIVAAGGAALPATGTNILVTLPITGGNTFTLSWPMEYTGWRLQSNAVDVTLTNYWFLVPGSDTTNRMTIMISPALTNVYYRMQHP